MGEKVRRDVGGGGKERRCLDMKMIAGEIREDMKQGEIWDKDDRRQAGIKR